MLEGSNDEITKNPPPQFPPAADIFEQLPYTWYDIANMEVLRYPDALSAIHVLHIETAGHILSVSGSCATLYA